jgi:hypothetical protein
MRDVLPCFQKRNVKLMVSERSSEPHILYIAPMILSSSIWHLASSVGIVAAPMRRASSAAFVGRDRRFAKADAVVALEPGPGTLPASGHL